MLNPLNYSLAQVQKFVTAAAIAAATLVVFFLHFDPSFQVAAVVVIGEVFAVVGVFAAKNHSADDVQKALFALAGGSLTLVGYFTSLNPGTVATILGIVSQVLLVAGTYLVSNQPSSAPKRA